MCVDACACARTVQRSTRIPTVERVCMCGGMCVYEMMRNVCVERVYMCGMCVYEMMRNVCVERVCMCGVCIYEIM